MTESTVVGVLIVTLSLCCVAVVFIAAWILVRFSKQLSLPAELAMRFPYRTNPKQYGEMAVCDAMAAGRQVAERAIPVDDEFPDDIPDVDPRADDPIPMIPGGYVPGVEQDQ